MIATQRSMIVTQESWILMPRLWILLCYAWIVTVGLMIEPCRPGFPQSIMGLLAPRTPRSPPHNFTHEAL